MAGIIISHGKTLDMQRRRKKFEETLVSANPHLGEGAKLAPGDVAPEDFDVFVAESLKHVRNKDFHVKEDNREIHNVISVSLRPHGFKNINNKSAAKVLKEKKRRGDYRQSRNASAPAWNRSSGYNKNRGGNSQHRARSRSQAR